MQAGPLSGWAYIRAQSRGGLFEIDMDVRRETVGYIIIWNELFAGAADRG